MRAHAVPPVDWTPALEAERQATAQELRSVYGVNLAEALVGFLVCTGQVDDFRRWSTEDRSPSGLVIIRRDPRDEEEPYLVVHGNGVDAVAFNGRDWTVTERARW